MLGVGVELGDRALDVGLRGVSRQVATDAGDPDLGAVAVLAADPDEMRGANTPEELAELERGLAARREPSAG